jgi:hypothetical protein
MLQDRIRHLDRSLKGIKPLAAGACVAALSALLLVPVWFRFDVVSKDGVHQYIPMGRFLLEGRFHEAISGPLGSSFPLPLYESFLALTARLTGFSLQTSGRLASAFFFVLGAVGIFFLAETLFKRRTVAFAALFLYLSNRLLLQNSVDCLKESLIVCIVLWGNYFIVRGLDLGNRAVHILAGAAILLTGIMVRSTTLVFLLAWMVVWIFHKRGGLLFRLVVVVVPVAVIVALAWKYPEFPLFRRSLSMMFIFRIIGNFASDKLGMLLWVVDLLRYFLKRSHYLAAFFGLWGLFHYRKNAYARHFVICMAIFLLVFMSRTRSFFSDRYMLAAVIYLMPMAAAMLVHALESRTSRLLPGLALVTLLFCPFLWGAEAFASPDPDKLARKEAGEYILSRIGPSWDIISNREQISLYAEGSLVNIERPPADDDPDRFVAFRNTDLKTRSKKITLRVVVRGGSVLKPIAMDTLLQEDMVWIRMLDRQGIKPDRIVRTIYIYLPAKAEKRS